MLICNFRALDLGSNIQTSSYVLLIQTTLVKDTRSSNKSKNQIMVNWKRKFVWAHDMGITQDLDKKCSPVSPFYMDYEQTHILLLFCYHIKNKVDTQLLPYQSK